MGVWFNWYLLVWIDVDLALDAVHRRVGPGVARRPVPLALPAQELPVALLGPQRLGLKFRLPIFLFTLFCMSTGLSF